MNLIRWIQSLLSHRGKALSLYRSGMTKANKGEFDGAIVDYTAVIESTDAPEKVKAMAFYNRALAYSAIHQDHKASADLDAVLAMPQVSAEVRTAALRRKERIRKRDHRTK